MLRLKLRLFSLTAVLALVSCGPVSAAEWGSLSGQFLYDGKPPLPKKLTITKDQACFAGKELFDESLVVSKKGGLANVVVYVRSKRVDVYPGYEETAEDEVAITNMGGRFSPHILPIRLSQTLDIKNADPCSHNSNLSPLGDTAVNPLLAPDGQQEYHFRREQSIPVPVTCNIHPWMKGYIVVRKNPYVAVSAEDGSFKLENLPAGELEFQAWHEKVGYLETSDWKKGRFKMKIKASENQLKPVKIKPSLFK